MSTKENLTDYWHHLVELAKKGADHQTDWQLINQLLKDADLDGDTSAESKFYHALTLVAKIDQAAKQPAKSAHKHAPPPPDEALMPSSKKSAELMIEAITFKDWDFLEEVLRIIKSQQKRVHPWALPAILDACHHLPDLFALLKSTAGARCSWLAAHQNKWYWWLRLDDPSWKEIPTAELLSWIYWQRTKGQIDLAAFNALTDKERKQLCTELITNTLPIDEIVGRKFLLSRSQKEQGQGMTILLRLPTAEQTQAKPIAEAYCRSKIKMNQSRLLFDEKKSSIAALPTDYRNISNSIFGDNPFLSLLVFFDPATIFGHLSIPFHDLFTQLIQDRKLEKLCIATVLSSASPGGRGADQKALILSWLDHYPSGNSRSAPFEIVIKKLSYDEVQLIFKHMLLDQSEYFIEKLLIVSANTDHYIGRELSMSLLEKIFKLISLSLSRTQVSQLSEAVQHLQYLLDPRTNQTIVTHWVEIDYRHKKLAETMREFRETIKRRSILLASIVQ